MVTCNKGVLDEHDKFKKFCTEIFWLISIVLIFFCRGGSACVLHSSLHMVDIQFL